ncbi:methyltransferase, TIGR04325 family [Paramagnetospirillum magneticum]|uniref:SAM-dependent methyltransferase n=1 Tax=Paramagnetospirillum magneticum (strain ATCC 700264 / AMB-1) TaxID=342108 RepID=Q2WBC1_PARM1|nr:methyltransferase, TIGR04325 family [Paramagnetospirillum magneticum]BAE48854.1 hypothetical protein amb0050 [Paramagnetospirillum magneticum AMB-1]
MADFNIWEGVYESFAQAEAHVVEPNRGAWLTRLEDRTRDMVHSHRTGTLAPWGQYCLPAVLAPLYATRDRLRVLDFGGGTGTTYLEVANALFGPDGRGNLDYIVVDAPDVCDIGRRQLGDAVRFLSSLDDVAGEFDLVHMGSVMQYLGDGWRDLLARLCAMASPFILFSDLVAGPIRSFVTLQTFYGGSQASRFYNLGEIEGAMSCQGFAKVMDVPYRGSYLGKASPIPMDNLPAENRLTDSRHALFMRRGGPKSAP